MKRSWASVITRGEDTYVLPWRSPTLAWQFVFGRAEAEGQPVCVLREIEEFIYTAELGAVTGTSATYAVEEACA